MWGWGLTGCARRPGSSSSALGPWGPLGKGDSDMLELEDFTLVMVWREDLGARSQEVRRRPAKGHHSDEGAGQPLGGEVEGIVSPEHQDRQHWGAEEI